MRLMGGTMRNPIPLPSLKAKCVPAGPAHCHRAALSYPIMPACPPPRAPSVWKHLTGSAIETKEPLLTLHVRPLGMPFFAPLSRFHVFFYTTTTQLPLRLHAFLARLLSTLADFPDFPSVVVGLDESEAAARLPRTALLPPVLVPVVGLYRHLLTTALAQRRAPLEHEDLNALFFPFHGETILRPRSMQWKPT